MTSRIVNLNSLTPAPLPEGMAPKGDAAERYAPRVAMVGMAIGAQKLGYNLFALAPGKRSFPFHSHRANEEAFLVLAGNGEVRIGAGRYPITTGDMIAAPAGGPETAHQIINTGTGELRYLAISTKLTPDIVEYPDSGRYSAIDDFGVGPDGQAEGFRAIGRRDEAADYWEGE